MDGSTNNTMEINPTNTISKASVWQTARQDVLSLLTYYGSETPYQTEYDGESSAVNVFSTLLKNVGKCHHLFADRLYITRVMLEVLLKEKYYFKGTLYINRKGFPQEIKRLILDHTESKFWVDNKKKPKNNLVTCLKR